MKVILNSNPKALETAKYLLDAFPEYRSDGGARGSNILGTAIYYNRPQIVNYLIGSERDPNPIYTFLTSAEKQTKQQKIEILRRGYSRNFYGSKSCHGVEVGFLPKRYFGIEI